eukprot:270915-Pyramimonas_sp.AAC.1
MGPGIDLLPVVARISLYHPGARVWTGRLVPTFIESYCLPLHVAGKMIAREPRKLGLLAGRPSP